MLKTSRKKVSMTIDIALDVIIEINNHLQNDILQALDMEELRERATQNVATERKISPMVVKDKYTKQLNLTIEEFMDMLLDWIHEKSNKLLEHMLQNAKNSEDRQYITLILSHD